MSAKLLNYVLFASLGFAAANEVAANCLYSNEDRVSRGDSVNAPLKMVYFHKLTRRSIRKSSPNTKMSVWGECNINPKSTKKLIWNDVCWVLTVIVVM